MKIQDLFEKLSDPLMGQDDPVIVVYNQQGKPIDRLALSVAADKYRFNAANAKQQFKHQDKVKMGGVTLSAPIAGQPVGESVALEETYDGDDFYAAYGDLWYNTDEQLDEAEYQGRKVKLGKPMRGDVKKFKVYVKNPQTGNVKKVNFGHGGTSAKRAGQKTMRIRKSDPARRRSFRARHNCANPGPRTRARYWSCRAW